MSTEYRFDEPALNIAQKIMECQATAAVDGWPDVRLKAAIQCLVIEAMKWAAPPILPIGELLQRLRDQTGEEWVSAKDTAAPEGWKLVPIEPTPEMCDISHVGVDVCTGMAADDEYYSINGDYAAKVYRAMLAAAPAPGGEHGN